MSPQNNALEQEAEDFVDELKPGTPLMHGQYTIEAFLAAGGFGITYLAKDSLNRRVVIKECFPGSFCRRQNASVLPRSRAHQAELRSIVQLFSQEAHSLAKTNHPNIVGVHHVFEENNTAYMALDYVDGRDLLEILNEDPGSLKPELVERYLSKMLDAIRHIHGLGILHRDIAPDNIIINERGEPILIDFGAARENTNEKVTRMLSALRVVKDGYSPQEFYISGSEQSPSCDLYSLAASFYHVITRELPPDAQWRLSACAAGDKDPYVPLGAQAQGYAPEFVACLNKAMAILPRDRMQTADEWMSQLNKPTRLVVESKAHPTAAAPVATAPKKKSMMPLILGSTGLVAAAGVGLMMMPSDSADAPATLPVQNDFAEAAAPAATETAPLPPVEIAAAPEPVEAAPVETAELPPAPALPPVATETALDEPIEAPAEVALAPIELEVLNPTLADTDAALTDDLSEIALGLTGGFSAPELRPVRLAELALVAAFDAQPTIDLSVPKLPVAADPESVANAEQAPIEDTPSTPASGVDFFVSMAKSQPELKSVLSGPMRSTASVSAPAATARSASAPSSIITNFVPAPPFTLSTSDPGLITSVSRDGPRWLTANTRIVSINGHPVATNGQINANFAALASGAASSRFDVTLGLTSSITGVAFEQTLTMNTEKHTLLLNGLKFRSVESADGWTTRVIEAPAASNFAVGDRLVSYVATWEDLDGPDTLKTILERDLAQGTSTFSFAVERDGEIWIEDFNLTSLAN